MHGHNAVGITYEIGDETSKDSIETIGKVTAEQMMYTLLDKISIDGNSYIIKFTFQIFLTSFNTIF